MEIDRKEVYRYLGYGVKKPDDNILALTEECIHELREAAKPKGIYRAYPLEWEGDGRLSFANMMVDSRSLSKNLSGCDGIAVFAATLGVGVDMLINRYSKTKLSRAVILQAAAAAMIEEYCDSYQQAIEEKMLAEGYYLRPRFSPGYGDFSIEHQKDIASLLVSHREIGLTVTESMMLMPSKSVTAVIGLSSQRENCHKKGCECCGKKDCQFRRDESN